jgi:hypothetical protein
VNNWYIATKEHDDTYRLWAGPYDTREAADAVAEQVKAIAYEIDGYLWWATWGTGRFDTDQPGKLNNRLALGPSKDRIVAYTHGVSE